MTGAGGVSIRYTVMAMTGLSDPTKTLECLDQQPLLGRLRRRQGRSHCSRRYAARPSLDGDLPFKKVFHVYKCTVGSGQVQGMDP